MGCFWVVLSLVLVYAFVSAGVAAIAGGNEFVGAIGGLVGAVAYVALVRWIWARHLGLPFYESREARSRCERGGPK